MKVQTINFKEISSQEIAQLLNEGSVIKPSKSELASLKRQLKTAFEAGFFIIARNILSVIVFFNCDEAFKFIQKDGLFRYSKYINQKCIVEAMASELLKICTTFNCLTTKKQTYLKSIIKYSGVLPAYNSIHKTLIKEFKYFEGKYPKKSFVKTLLVYVDFLFLKDHLPTNNDPNLPSNRAKEDISLAASYLIYLYTENKRHTNISFHLVAEEYLLNKEIDRVIAPVCFLQTCKQFEILIDHFEYEYLPQKNGPFLLKSTIENFERAMRLGYIKTSIQEINDRPLTNNMFSMEELVNKITKEASLKLFQYSNDKNYPRYRIEIPEHVYEFLISNFIKPDELFEDEVVYLSSIFKEQILTLGKLKKIIVRNDLNLFEFMKIRRVFLLFYTMFATEIYKKGSVDLALLYRSLVPTYTNDLFFNFIERLFPTTKIDAFLDIICWEPGLDIIFDLQYQPILQFDDNFLVAISVLSNSNTIRNLYASEYKQDNVALLSDGSDDPLVEKLSNAFFKAKIKPFEGSSIGITDIDLFAIYEDTLFVFECKHNLHPVSMYDLRTTYDYIRKAETQLDKIVQEFNKGTLGETLSTRHKISMDNVTKIQGAIILSNRMLNGNIFKYPVRNINELDNILTGGTISTKSGTYWLWKEKKLTKNFLMDYFSLNNDLVKTLYDSLSPRKLVYSFESLKIEYNTYYLDISFGTDMIKKFTDQLELVE